jgi:hypothetical protein
MKWTEWLHQQSVRFSYKYYPYALFMQGTIA